MEATGNSWSGWRLSLSYPCTIALLIVVTQLTSMCMAEERETVGELFQKAVISTTRDYIQRRGAVPGMVDKSKEFTDYIQIRRSLLARAGEAREFLEQTRKSTGDWRENVAAQVFLGWIDHSELYKELWDWRAPMNQNRNPLPGMRSAARHKFLKAGKKAVPIMLELIWKKGWTHYGVLPQLLAEWKVEASMPVLAEAGAAEALGSFGQKATPSIIGALKKKRDYEREQLIKALGLTGDRKSSPLLRKLLKEEKLLSNQAMAAVSLGRLKEFSILREEISETAAKGSVLRVLGQDGSALTREFLYKYARKSLIADHRFEAVKAILQKPTDKDMIELCKIIPHEPHDYTRSSMYLYLSRPKSQLVRKTLLRALDDDAKWVRIRAIEGLEYYQDEEVTKALVSFLRSGNICKKNALFTLKERQSGRIAEAVIPLLNDEDEEIQEWAARAIEINPRKEAIEPLIDLLSSENSRLRQQAARSLAKIGGERSMKSLTEALENEKDPWVKRTMVEVIEASRK